MTRREGKRRGVRRETMSGGGGDEMDGRWRLVGGRGKGPSVAAALSFRRRARRVRAEYDQSERETNEMRDEAMGAVA